MSSRKGMVDAKHDLLFTDIICFSIILLYIELTDHRELRYNMRMKRGEIYYGNGWCMKGIVSILIVSALSGTIACVFKQRSLDKGCAIAYDGIMIDAGEYSDSILQALKFLERNEPETYLLAKRYIREITWEGNPFWSLTHFPDSVSLSTYSLKRGRVYLASLLFHELNHILFFKIRLSSLGEREYRIVAQYYKSLRRIEIARIKGLSNYEEERLIHRLQLTFLERHGDRRDIELQRIIIENLPRTYYHLRR
jgi:hypothetical protein